MSSNFYTLAVRAINEHSLFKSGDTVIVACSGGADSMALLDFLYNNVKQFGVNLRAAHVNHNLRAQNSKGDELFVKDYCKNRDISLDIKDLHFDKAPSEDECRQQRYKYFYELSQKYSSAKIATAHSKNDNAETILLHIARGSGLFGMCGIPPKRDIFIRPLILLERTQIEQYCNENNIEYRQDESNFTELYARNKVRLNVLPKLLEINEQALSALERLAQTANETNDYMKQSATRLIETSTVKNKVGESGFDRDTLASAHVAVLKTALHMLISPHADATQKRIELCQNAVMLGSGGVELSKKATFTVRQNVARVEVKNDIAIKNTSVNSTNACAALPLETLVQNGKTVMQDGASITIKIINYDKTVNFNKKLKKDLKNVADYGKIQGNIVLRAKMQGDMFRNAKSKVNKPLKKVYSEAKLSENIRNVNPVLAIDSEIIWANGFGFAHGYAVDENTKVCIEIEFKQ